MSLFIHRCTIERNTPTNQDGEIKPSWAELATGVACLLQEGRGRLRQGIDGRGLEYDAILFIDNVSQSIKPQAQDDDRDRVKITSPSRLGGPYYLVEHVADECGMEDHLTAFLKRTPAPT